MWPASATITSRPFAHVREAARDLGRRIAAAREPAAGCRESAAAIHSTGRRDRAPDRVDVVHARRGRERQLVLRIGAQPRGAVGQRLRPVRRQELRLVARQSRVGSSAGDRRPPRDRGTARTSADRAAHRATCATCFGARARRSPPGTPKPSSATTCATLVRARAGEEHRDVGAEAVTGDVDRLAGRQRMRERVEIGDVVGKPVAVLRRFATDRSRASRARARANRPRARRPGTGTTPTRPSSHAGERACVRPDRPTCARDSERPRTVDEPRARRLHRGRAPRASLLLALGEAVLPADAIVAVVAEAHRILLLACRGPVAQPSPKPSRYDGGNPCRFTGGGGGSTYGAGVAGAGAAAGVDGAGGARRAAGDPASDGDARECAGASIAMTR